MRTNCTAIDKCRLIFVASNCVQATTILRLAPPELCLSRFQIEPSRSAFVAAVYSDRRRPEYPRWVCRFAVASIDQLVRPAAHAHARLLSTNWNAGASATHFTLYDSDQQIAEIGKSAFSSLLQFDTVSLINQGQAYGFYHAAVML